MVGCTLSVLQQFTGINAITFYSSTIFSSASAIPANYATALVQGVNCASVVIATGMLNFYGRRTLMLVWTAAGALFIFIMGLATIRGDGTLELAMTMLFVMAFEFGPGPVVWIYMSEIMNDKGVSIGTFLSWTFTLIIGLIVPSLMNSIHGYTFILFGCISTLSTVFIYFFMKETKGLTEEQVKHLYRTDIDRGSTCELKQSNKDSEHSE